MNTQLRRTLSMAMAVMATACGGGSEPTSSAVTPPPPPVSTPIAVPPPDLSGPVGLTQLSDFPTLGFAYRYTTDANDANPQGPSAPDSTEVIAFSYSAEDQVYEITIPGSERARLKLEYTYEAATSHSLAPPPRPNFWVWLHRPGANNPYNPLEYTSYGGWDPSNSSSAANSTGYFAYGVPTGSGDVPLVGSRKYNAEVFGATSASLGVWWVFGGANLTFDFSQGRLAGTLGLGVNPGGPGHMDFGSFPFAATSYAVGETRFSGRFSVPGGGEEGFFEGQFTGPQASEVMVRWVLPHSDPQTGAPGSLFGIFVGRSQND